MNAVEKPSDDVWAHINVGPKDKCWLAKHVKGGRAVAYVRGEVRGLAQWVWETVHGQRAERGPFRRCETPECCNPDHLSQAKPEEEKRAAEAAGLAEKLALIDAQLHTAWPRLWHGDVVKLLRERKETAAQLRKAEQ